MTKPDLPRMTWQDIPAAIGLLTRLPIPVDADSAQARGAAAVWAYPLVGLVLGTILAVLATVLMAVNLPAPVTAMGLLACSVVITGGLHEDGLSDSADGLWGGWEKARRLEIMKDSRIGAYGVLALVLSLGLRAVCLALLLESPWWLAALIVPATVSRAAMVVVMRRLPHARRDGLSRAVGQPPHESAVVALLLALLVALVFSGLTAVICVVVAALATLACMAIARRKIGGQTGDILGATQQVTEIAVLMCLTTQLGAGV